MSLSRHAEEEDRLYNAMVRTAKSIIRSAALVSITLLAYACGGGGSDDNGDNGGDGPFSFDVSMGDNFFEPKEFTVETGQKVTFNLTNGGIAIHNMRVAGADNEYNTDDDALSDPSLLSSGDTGTLEWTAPDKAGEIDLRCEFHPADSTGIIKVE